VNGSKIPLGKEIEGEMQKKVKMDYTGIQLVRKLINRMDTMSRYFLVNRFVHLWILNKNTH